MDDWVSELLRYGPLGLFAAGVCYVVWWGLRNGSGKLYQLGERYVASTESLHDSLIESDKEQANICKTHAAGLTKIADAAQKTSDTLIELRAMHVGPDGKYTQAQAIDDVRKLRQAAKRACEMCEFLAVREDVPEADKRIAEHVAAIRKIMSRDSDVQDV